MLASASSPRLTVFAISTSVLTLCPALVHAQGTSTEPSTPVGGRLEEDAASGRLPEIVITANRREESAQKAALALQVIDGEDLERLGITQLKDLTALVPAFNVGSRGSFTQIYLRGVGAFITTPLDESPVAVNFDQVNLSSPAGVSGMFFDLERLEVLKGPQGTLYGRNASGGALNIVTRKPELGELGGFISGELGNFGLQQAEGALNIPLSQGSALRGAFQIVDRGGYYKDGSGDDVHQSGRLHALVEPSATTSLLITADYSHVGGDGEGFAIYPRLGDPYIGLLDPRVTSFLAQNPTLKPLGKPYQDNDVYGIQANLQVDLGGVTLNVIPAWRRTKLDFSTSGSGSVYTVTSTEPQKTLEARLASKGGDRPISWVVGAYYFDLKKDLTYLSDFGPRNQISLESGKLKNKSAAAFADVKIGLTRSLRALGGVRYTHEKKSQNGSVLGTARNVTILTLSEGSFSFNKVSWRGGLEYDLTRSSMLFATVANGFKSGSFVLTPASDGTPNNPFANFSGPEFLTAYTVGAKSRIFHDRVQLNVEGFLWDYKDQQITQNGPVNPIPNLGRVITNVPDSPTIHGVDASLAWRVGKGGLFSADLAYLKTRYDKLVLVGSSRSSSLTTGCVIMPAADPRLRLLDCSGFPLIRSPRWSGAVGYQHRFDLKHGQVMAELRSQFSSRYFTGIDYLPSQVQKRYTNTSAGLTYESPDETWSLTAYVRNLEDEAVATASRTHAFLPGVSFDVLNPPRTYGIRGRFSF